MYATPKPGDEVLVCGGRDFNDAAFIHAELDRLLATYRFKTVIEGDARGVDRIAGEWARARGVEIIEFPADWKNEGRHPALIRDERMLREGKSDLVIAFPGGNGTSHTCWQAGKIGIPVIKIDRMIRRSTFDNCGSDLSLVAALSLTLAIRVTTIP